MIARIEEITINDKKVICKDLKYGYILKLETGEVTETKHDVIANGTDLTVEEIMELRKGEVEELYTAVSRLTYPQYYNEDGTIKEFENTEDGEEDKKKD